ncbi:hypothetical protein PoB_001529900 [Plakobranchus ocellatus]|uniref:Uncharacterized protein n=1 Tax=Plakobranchus ocellatus TaxID=259542 RepID=A0AAV3Z478_9GAST|nr:hypothetical protein PoB_001529900 [Plakobranchus ocellatus]
MKAQTHSQTKTQQKRPLTRRRQTSRQQSGPGGQNNIQPTVHITNYDTLNREEQTIIFCLRTGQNRAYRLRKHMYTKLKIGETPICQCEQGPQSAELVLQTCPNLTILRHLFWPEPTSLTEKLQGEGGGGGGVGGGAGQQQQQQQQQQEEEEESDIQKVGDSAPYIVGVVTFLSLCTGRRVVGIGALWTQNAILS